MSKLVTTAESPIPVSQLNDVVKGWIERLGVIWVEGQITQLKAKPNWKLAYVTLRDTERQASVELTCPSAVIRKAPMPLSDGARVVVRGKPAFYAGRGSFSLWVTEIRPVGIGELLARIEALRTQLREEGLFDAERKRPIPYLPGTVGLITSRDSAAERDVLAVASDRWPEVSFRVEHAIVQGAAAAGEVVAALQTLDADPHVDVIIIARGGGSVEDLLPFSEESLQRAVAAATTPVVSAIGHEPDHPVLDDVADLRAATPTDAAKRVVPDVLAERALITEARQRTAGALRGWVRREETNLAQLRSRPVLADPQAALTQRGEELGRAIDAARRAVRLTLSTQYAKVESLRAQVSTLGPAATLDRGYSIVQVIPRDGSDPQVVTQIEQSPPGSQLRIRVADGSITAAGMSTRPAD